MSKACVIIGASHAASQCVASLRMSGWEDDIVLVGDEPALPYHHPPLSKDFLSGIQSEKELLIRPRQSYVDAGVTLKLGMRITSIDRAAKTINASTGEVIAYEKLVLATGARVRPLPVKGAGLPNVFYLRDMADGLRIKSAVKAGRRAVVIGGGYIGLETAASLRKLGVKVTILEAMPRILQRVTAPVFSEFYARIHREEGVDIVENAVVSHILKTDDGLGIYTGDNQEFDADFVVIGIGVIPNVELALEAGLDCSNGIEVNRFCQTSDTNIYAIGDVTWHYNSHYKRNMRLESVPNATDQAKVVASHMCGIEKVYDSLPWFWSDQFDLKLQIAGLSDGYDSLVLRGDPIVGRSFAGFYFKGDRLLAVDAVNSPREFAFARMVLSKGKMLDKNLVSDLSLALPQTLAK